MIFNQDLKVSGGTGSLKQNTLVSDSLTNVNSNITIGKTPIYLPFTDSVVSSPDQEVYLTVEMSHESSSFLKNTSELGKFYKINVQKSNDPITFRAYYDLDEMQNSSSLENLTLFKWDSNNNDWTELQIQSSNSTLHYIEVNIIGSQIVKFGSIRFLPNFNSYSIILIPILFVMVIMISLIFLTILKNIKLLLEMKKLGL